ncbi:hypothetical protein LHYA1_G007550 [Lachnellula hyalina]|uniref:Uncharacterized protein n=1 Tax=Lachnellula hyalina TaxID=1316788 RepID=A0A8H8TZA3_9HELO|nr:uncharacterized protein LHYA1_G007550 [Lachnellula hyalina]TVY24761.1 hypothetical protein LHYA1_G007550 [Lachnellula hyalina]
MWATTIAVSLLLASRASAGVIQDVGHMARRDNSMEETMKRYVDALVEPVERRQATEGTGAVNGSQWEMQTEAACTASLQALGGVASNPSGMAVCYNLPFLDNTTGVFQADLRLYTVSAPTGDFANIATQNVQVGLAYNGATVSAVNSTALKARGSGISLISWPRGMEKRETAVPAMAQSYAFVGQINKNLLTANMGTAALQKVLVPTVSLTAVNGSGQTVNTTLSSQEATFVNGVFADQVVPTKSQVSPPIQTLVVASGAPFVVPGLNILIFPIGAIITGVWAVLLTATIAYGTVGRMQFRDQFRRRNARATKGDLARI